MKSAIRRAARLGLLGLIALTGLSLTVLALGRMARSAGEAWGEAYVRRDVESLPSVEAALVLGTAPLGRRGQNFRTLSWRLNAAFALWSAGKARTLIVSGIRVGQNYDEPAIMRDGLVALGVPTEFIRRDSDGARTWDQVLHGRTIFGEKRLIIVSQRDHLARALFLARHAGIEAWGVPARGVTYGGWRASLVGDLASLVAFYDVMAPPPARSLRR